MEEEKVKEEIKEEKKPDEDILELAEKKRKEIEDAKRQLDESIKRSEKFIAESIIRGKSWAGKQEDPLDEFKESAEKYAQALGRTFK